MRKLLCFLLLLPVFAHAQIISTIAGNNTTPVYGGDGGPADSAYLNRPGGVAVDDTGNIYVADAGNGCVRKITPGGIISTYATGFVNPRGMALDRHDNLYVADQAIGEVLMVTPAGIVSVFAGGTSAGFAGDGGPAIAAVLNWPAGVAVDTAGNVYIADTYNQRIRIVNTAGIINTYAGGSIGYAGDGGPATDAMLNNPVAVATDTLGNLYIADQFNGCVRKVDAGGVITTIAGTGVLGFSGDGGAATAAQLYLPSCVALDGAGNLFVSDQGSQRIRKINTSGIISTVCGTGAQGFSGDGGIATAAKIYCPAGVAIDMAGNIVVADRNNNRVRKITATDIITTIAGHGIYAFGNGGPATTAYFIQPADVAVDKAGNVYISDNVANCIRKVDTFGMITNYAGNSVTGYSGDGSLAINATLNEPLGIAFDDTGNLYIVDVGNNRIRKVDTTGIISTIAGTGGYGYSGDGGPATAAQLLSPWLITVDKHENLFFSDQNLVIREVNNTGIITTVAGNDVYGFSGDGGPAIDAEFESPASAAVDATGNVYIADMGNNRIRKVNTAGIINTIAGDGTAGFGGDGGPAAGAVLNSPECISSDTAGNLYIADAVNSRIRMINASGTISTVAGDGTPGYSGDGGLATAAELNYPTSVKPDANGNLYILDENNYVIRKVSNISTLNAKGPVYQNTITIFPNPTHDELTIQSGNEPIASISITNLLGQCVQSAVCSSQEQVTVDVSGLPAGIYFVKINNTEVKKFVKE